MHTHTNVHVHKTNTHVQKETYEETVPQSSITWSDLRKLNVQAKKVHNENKTSIHNGAFIQVGETPYSLGIAFVPRSIKRKRKGFRR